jgi:hypothetical protein
MKKVVSIITVLFGVLFGALPLASAATIYTENWGSPNTTVQTANTLGLVGWTVIANRQGGVGPYYGIYLAAGANDPALGLGLPVNTVYLTGLSGASTNQLGGPAMLYTTDTAGAGSAGNSAFADINPTLYTNLTFNVEIRVDGGNCPNYFAVQVGGSWYVCTNNPFPTVNAGNYPVFTNWSMVYTNSANAWYSLTQGATSVTVGGPATPNFSSLITGIGIVEATNTAPGGNNGFNYNEIVINQGPGDFPSSPPVLAAVAVTPQYVYAGGGASFLPSFSGAPTLVYAWKTNGVNVAGARFLGANTTSLNITNASTNDALWTYSVAVTNFFGKATNDGLVLNVSTVPAGLLYAETFPYVGPNGNLPITGAGWVSSASGTTAVGIYQDTPGKGDVFSYSPAATTNVYYTTTTNDTGLSGLPFAAINPASYPAITLQAGFVPGNGAGQVPGAITVYWAVAMNGTWYASAQPVQITLTALSPYLNYQLGFNPAATNWNNLTITSTGGIIGSQASGALAGNITGAGLVIAHNTASGSDMNFQNFEILTNQFVGTAPSIGTTFPLSVGVASGGGASFGVSATGTQPFTYGWTTNGVPVQNGGRVSGATTATLTIANLNSNDNNMQIVAFVTNSAGFDESDSIYGATTLTVTNPPVGLIYSEQFPFVGPLVANYPISSVGWVEAVPSAPNALFQTTANTSEGAVFAYLGVPGTTVYYATTATDTNQVGLPFPNINLASYPSLNFSVDIAPSSSASNVTAYVAVQLNGTDWYVAASSLAVPTTTDSPTYANYTLAFNPAAANWKNLTVTGSGGLVGPTAASKLSGVMTGAGLVFVTIGTGGNFNFDNFQITGTGLGGINVGPLTGGNINLSWVGNPAVNLQSTTNLIANWQDVPNTLGLYSLTVPVTGPQKFFRLVEH